MVWFIKKLDWWLVGAVFFLFAVGLLMMISLGGSAETGYVWFWRQLAWVGIGLVVFLVAALTDYRMFRIHTPLVLGCFLASALLLAAVLFWGETIRGSRAWISFWNFRVQPVEFAKIAVVMLLAKYYAGKNMELWRVRHIIVPAAASALLIVLVLLQPDWGSAFILFSLWFILTLLSGIRLRQLLFVVLFCILGAALSWQFLLSGQQQARISVFLNPENDPSGISYSARQAVTALGSGRMLGKGIGLGTQTQLEFLPEPRTDFIFAAIGEELGFIGTLAVLLGFAIILWRIFLLTSAAQNNFAKLFSAGVFALIFLHLFIHTGVNLRLLPVAGIPLPFVSYGGSNLIMNFLALGILASIRIRQ